MKAASVLGYLLLTCCMWFDAGAQFQGQVYYRDNGVHVMEYSREKRMPWCGGFDNPQFAMADLNQDGIPDMVTYERDTKQIKTFLNTGTAGNPMYRYVPEYAKNFPQVDEYLKLEDYNRDGIPDLFHRGLPGVLVYKGYYNASHELCFNFYKDLYYNNDTHSVGDVDVYVEPSDIPAIVDVDNDGDLDVIAYYSGGGVLYFYQNLQVEAGLPTDSIRIRLADRCWGRVYQAFYRTHQLNYQCDNTGLNKGTLHTGNCITLFKADGDNDYDYMDGNISYSDIQFLKNGRVENGTVDSMVVQDTLWQSNGAQLNIPQWPSSFWLDIDNDGKKDLVFSPHAYGTENVKTVAFYKNTGTASNPTYTYQPDSFLVKDIIDAGSSSYPMLYDYNRDGKPDLIVGSDGYYQANGTMRSRLVYYENTSQPFYTSFTLRDADFDSVFAQNFRGSAPATGDLDNDGKDDLVLGKTDGTIAFFPNTAATAAAQPDWSYSAGTQLKLKDSAGVIINVGSNFAAPFIYDMNKDGKPDLIVGNWIGRLVYYENVGTVAGQVKLKLITDTLGNVRTDPDDFTSYTTPFIGKMDNTGTDYILAGSSSGAIYRFDGFQAGNTGVVYPKIDSLYSFINDGQRSAPTVGDIDGDGKYEMIVGNMKGGLTIFSQNQWAGIDNVAGNNKAAQILVYPNPTDDVLHFSWNKDQALNDIHVTLYNAIGQKLSTAVFNAVQSNAILDVHMLPTGIYFCEITSGLIKQTSLVTVTR